MRAAGHDPGKGLKIAIDARLPIMGYTVPSGEGFQIVVSGWSVESGMLGGLIIHELSHVVRTRSGHPSHNDALVQGVLSRLDGGVITTDYQARIIQDLVNNFQDLYADDIAFQVFKNSEDLTAERISGFLQGWMADSVKESGDAQRDRWENANLLVRDARAMAQMERHHIEDIGGKGAQTRDAFLGKLPPKTREDFDYFRTTFVTMKEDIAEPEYQRLLTDFLRRFLGTVDRIARPS